MINYFDQSSATYNQQVVSTIDRSLLVTRIQSDSTDTYFDSTSEIRSVMVQYDHQDSRQRKRIYHDGAQVSGIISWSPTARDGTWLKNLVIARDSDGASHSIGRSVIGTSEDIVMTDGTMTLNLS